jgi:hypothetical protein
LAAHSSLASKKARSQMPAVAPEEARAAEAAAVERHRTLALVEGPPIRIPLP